MRHYLLTFLAAAALFGQRKVTDEEVMRVHKSAFLIDTHNDVTSKTVTGFDIDADSCKKLRANGGSVATSVRELSRQCAIILIAVYSGEQVEGLFDKLVHGAGSAKPVVISTTTCAPDEIIRLSERAATAGIALLEAPISGTSAEARNGTAMALLAGDADVIESVRALLDR